MNYSKEDKMSIMEQSDKDFKTGMFQMLKVTDTRKKHTFIENKKKFSKTEGKKIRVRVR